MFSHIKGQFPCQKRKTQKSCYEIILSETLRLLFTEIHQWHGWEITFKMQVVAGKNNMGPYQRSLQDIMNCSNVICGSLQPTLVSSHLAHYYYHKKILVFWKCCRIEHLTWNEFSILGALKGGCSQHWDICSFS